MHQGLQPLEKKKTISGSTQYFAKIYYLIFLKFRVTIATCYKFQGPSKLKSLVTQLAIPRISNGNVYGSNPSSLTTP